MKVDLISVAEAAYRLDLSDEAWLRNLAELVRPELDQGFGVVAWTRISGGSRSNARS